MSASVDRRLALAVLALPVGVVLVPTCIALGIALAFGQTTGCGEGSGPAGEVKGVPAKLIPIYREAAARYGLGAKGPAILAAINWEETRFGADLGVSSAAAEGWMQFLPESWRAFGVDGNGDGVKDPYDPRDAILAAARLLRYSGAPGDWHGAIYSYNHAEWYVQDVLADARKWAAIGSLEGGEGTCGTGGNAVLDEAVTSRSPRAFKALPSDLWAGGGVPETVDARIWPDAVWLLRSYGLRATAAREAGHQTHGDGTAMDMVPAPGRGWDETARRAADDLGWREGCGVSGSAPLCPLVPAIQFVGYNGYPGHGDPAHAGANAHLHVSWVSSDYGCPGLCAPRAWVRIFPLG